jgi:hypothetical protein
MTDVEERQHLRAGYDDWPRVDEIPPFHEAKILPSDSDDEG